jgi:serine/threonine-protein kinase
MALAPGTRVGAYEIVSAIGGGGMGEVYRATDTKLKRPVAVKVLPASLASDRERVARLRREAEVLAALNHPHIAQIYGLEDSTDVTALVLELVEGPTLADRLARGPMSVDEVLPIAKQIAEALEAAHERGIIHRDLKPANIKVRPDGTVKVLDFGLAKVFEPPDSAPDAPIASTRTVAGTGTGIILGTAAYMSPEQACGKAVDTRTDIWAFGCVVFEMLARCRPFPGETTTEVIAAALEREPDLTKLPAATPWSVRRLVSRCLQKNPARRLRDIGDARLDLEEALYGDRAQAADSASLRTRSVSRTAAIVAAGLLVGIVATAVIFRALSPAAPPSHPVTRFAIPLGQNEFIDPTHSPVVAISSDGSKVAYPARGSSTEGQPIYVRWSDQDQPKALPGVLGAVPFFSPDGQWVGYWQGRTRTIRKVALSGGAPIALADVDSVSGVTWGEDGNIVWAWFNLFSIPASGGTPKTLLTVDIDKGERFFRHPQYLPGSKAILFTIGTGDIEGYEDARIAVFDLTTGKYKTLVEGGSMPRYSTTGHLVYARGGSLFAIPFDVKKLVVTGQPFPVLDGIFSSRNTGMADFGIAANGDLAYVPGPTEAGRRRLVWVDRQGHVQPFDLAPQSYLHPRLSPDGSQLAFEIEGPAHDLYAYDLSRGVTTRLSFDGASHWPVWSPTGERIAFRSWKTSGMTLWSMPVNQSRKEEALPAVGHMLSPESWSPDGKTIAYLRMDDMRHFDVWELPLDGDRKPHALLESSKFLQGSPKYSPDGRWLAYGSNESGRPEVFITQYPGPGAKIQVSTEGGFDPVWRRDSREVYYRSGDKMMVVSVTTTPKLALSAPRVLWEGHYAAGSASSCGMSGVASANYDVTADGQRFVMVEDKDQDLHAHEVDVIVNFASMILRAEDRARRR